MLADVRMILIEEFAADVVVVAAGGAELQQATDAAQVENLPEDLGVVDHGFVTMKMVLRRASLGLCLKLLCHVSGDASKQGPQERLHRR